MINYMLFFVLFVSRQKVQKNSRKYMSNPDARQASHMPLPGTELRRAQHIAYFLATALCFYETIRFFRDWLADIWRAGNSWRAGWRWRESENI